MSGTMLAEEFAAKANANARFVVAALKALGPEGFKGAGGVPSLGLQIANQLIVEGLELALKATMLTRGGRPPPKHELEHLYSELDAADKSLVDKVVREAVLESATGSVPLGLPNFVSATIRHSDAIGQKDPIEGYKEMDAEAFFRLLDTLWLSKNSQYLGADSSFTPRGVLRTDLRVLAGGILACLQLSESLGSCSLRFSTQSGTGARRRSPRTRPSHEDSGGAGRPHSQEITMTMTVIDYVDGVQVLNPAAEKFELWHQECAVEMEIVGEGLKLLQPATDADTYKCAGCGKPIPIIRRNMPGHYVPGYDRAGENRVPESSE